MKIELHNLSISLEEEEYSTLIFKERSLVILHNGIHKLIKFPSNIKISKSDDISRDRGPKKTIESNIEKPPEAIKRSNHIRTEAISESTEVPIDSENINLNIKSPCQPSPKRPKEAQDLPKNQAESPETMKKLNNIRTEAVSQPLKSSMDSLNTNKNHKAPYQSPSKLARERHKQPKDGKPQEESQRPKKSEPLTTKNNEEAKIKVEALTEIDKKEISESLNAIIRRIELEDLKADYKSKYKKDMKKEDEAVLFSILALKSNFVLTRGPKGEEIWTHQSKLK